jgi:S-adenosylmethionine hydrolase
MKKLTVIADWAADQLLTNELRTVITGFTNHPDSNHIYFVPTNHTTIHGAYILSQLIEREERNGRPLESVFFMGTNKSSSTFNVIRLFSGIYICGMNAELNFSMIKPKIEEIYEYKAEGNANKNELYLRVAAHLVEAQEDALDLEEIPSSVIPEIEDAYVGHIDSFNNLKTTMKLSSLKGAYEIGDSISVTIHDKAQAARFVQTMREANENEMAITGSLIGDPNDPYLQIGMKSKKSSIHDIFGIVSPGDKIHINT